MNTIEDLKRENNILKDNVKKLSKAITYFRNRKDNLIKDVEELCEELEAYKTDKTL